MCVFSWPKYNITVFFSIAQKITEKYRAQTQKIFSVLTLCSTGTQQIIVFYNELSYIVFVAGFSYEMSTSGICFKKRMPLCCIEIVLYSWRIGNKS